VANVSALLFRDFEVTVKKLENKVVYYKETVGSQHLIFWPGSQRRVHCHTAKPESDQRVSICWVPLLMGISYLPVQAFICLHVS
jgi:hypothetical protein